jgi:hypothetical protein
MWFTGINYYKLAVEKDRDSIFTTIRKPGLKIIHDKHFSSRHIRDSSIRYSGWTASFAIPLRLSASSKPGWNEDERAVTATLVRECSLFIPGVGTEEKLIEKRKKQPPTLSINHFFPYPTIAWLGFLFYPPQFQNYTEVFYIYTYILLYKLGHHSTNSTVHIWCTNRMSNIIICTFTSSYYVPKPPRSCSPTISRCCTQRGWRVWV